MSPVVSVARPLCGPSRDEAGTVANYLAGYHVRLHGLSAETVTGGDNRPQYYCINVSCSSYDTARWVEYLILRKGWPVVSRPIDPENWRRAAAYVHQKPAGAWYQLGCKDKPKETGKGQPQTPTAAGDLPLSAPPTPWDSRPRDWWNHLEQPAQPQPKKRKRGGWFGL
jgi:hypothetical protein